MNRALRVAVVGSGPAGMYAAGHLLEPPSGTLFGSELKNLVHGPVEVDVIERLPTPWGLIRAGVAPDHPEKKRMTAVYDSIARRRGFRFLGNVQVGRDISVEELGRWYDAVIYAVGANDERQLGIPGESLPGSSSARQFVSWYNGHPDFSGLDFDLGTERMVLIGNGNVAMDVARIILSPVEYLKETDIACYALDALGRSRVKEVVIVGRRGPEHAAYNYPELAELGELPDTAIVVEGADLSQCGSGLGYEARLKLDLLATLAKEKTRGSRRIIFRFNALPTEITGSAQVEKLHLKNRVESTPEKTSISTGLVLAAIGYRGCAIEGLPFDPDNGVIPSREGRVMDGEMAMPGTYVTGWIRRGPRGIIGTNKKCARNAVRVLIEDAKAGLLNEKETLSAVEIYAALNSRVQDVVPFSGWRNIDLSEQARGGVLGRPRMKFTSVDTMLVAAGSG